MPLSHDDININIDDINIDINDIDDPQKLPISSMQPNGEEKEKNQKIGSTRRSNDDGFLEMSKAVVSSSDFLFTVGTNYDENVADRETKERHNNSRRGQ